MSLLLFFHGQLTSLFHYLVFFIEISLTMQFRLYLTARLSHILSEPRNGMSHLIGLWLLDCSQFTNDLHIERRIQTLQEE